MSSAADRARDVISALFGEDVRVRSMPADWSEPEKPAEPRPGRVRAHMRATASPQPTGDSDVLAALRQLERAVREQVARELESGLEGVDPGTVRRAADIARGHVGG